MDPDPPELQRIRSDATAATAASAPAASPNAAGPAGLPTAASPTAAFPPPVLQLPSPAAASPTAPSSFASPYSAIPAAASPAAASPTVSSSGPALPTAPLPPLAASSLKAAQTAGKSAVAEDAVRGQQWVPFDEQIPVGPEEKVFRVHDQVYLGSEFGALDPCVFAELQVTAVINITNGDRKVPNEMAANGVEYVNFEIADQPGENILREGIREGVPKIDAWVAAGKTVLVHCSAGLSRSASMVVAWCMHAQGMPPQSLGGAVARVQAARGRRLQINPSFWMNLATWERELFHLPAGTMPTQDFTPWWVEGFSRMGFTEDAIRRALEVGDWVNFEPAFQHLLGA